MSDEVVEPTQDEYNAARLAGEIDETGHATDPEEDETNDEPDTFVKPEDAPAPEATAKPRPWIAKEDGDGTQGGIPNARWAANRVALRTRDQEIEEARAQIAALQAKVQPQEQEITDPNQIDKAKFVKPDGEFDGDAYLAAREEVVLRNAERRFEQRQQAKEHEKQISDLVDSYIAAVQEEAKTNPEIIAAVQHLNQLGPQMHPAVATILMKMPPAVSFEIACNEQYIAQLVNGHPAESLALLGELKAEVKARGAKPAAIAQAPTAPVAFKPSAPVKHVPKTVSASGSGRKDPEQMTQAEYDRFRARGGL